MHTFKIESCLNRALRMLFLVLFNPKNHLFALDPAEGPQRPYRLTNLLIIIRYATHYSKRALAHFYR
jgi:hypothetical protein